MPDKCLFRKQIEINRSEFDISHNDHLLLLGSCFSKSICQKLKESGFCVSYPFGTLYNPFTIAQNLNRVLNSVSYVQKDIVLSNEIFFSWHHCGTIFNDNGDELIQVLNKELEQLEDALSKAKYLIITFGSAFVYEHPSIGIVGNCHKIPLSDFKKRMLTVNEIIDQWNILLNTLNDKQIIFTVSPVRHWADGPVQNTRSKSTLHLVIDELINNNDNCVYFPSYEIMIDELRDHRFYKRDMLHPSDEAVDHIWDKFKMSSMDQRTIEIINEVKKIRSGLNHRPFDPNSNKHLSFLHNLLKMIDDISELTPLYSWEEEKSLLNSQLK